ncbi:hypothetical protein PRZ48_001789 [Zasmidium cellare]|uniref:Zn(2)-C6 fungal-type domain-containing protein n=1 Tax=Zasmidium cellare TaxID=395010 RepID=A0ABR0F2G0_ZASCE|nr:hypothetical protein PRZ48_001789 [Zasmidium cellare]
MSDAESADKKRNKLGYQRISIACDDDAEQRCQNCIRLKKECVFYPVDQQAAIDARSEASSKAGVPSGPSSTVSSSPTQLANRQLNTTGQHYGSSYHNATVDSPGSFQGIPIPPGSNIPPQGNRHMVDNGAMRSDRLIGGYAPPEFGYSHRESPSWNPQEYGAHPQAVPVAGTASMPPQFARYGNVPGDSAPFPGSMEQQPQSARPADTMGYPSEHLQQWQQQQAHQPVRSMSFPDYPNHNAYNHPVYPIDQQAPGSYVQRHPQPQSQRHDPRLVPMAPPHQVPVEHHQQYMVPHDQRGAGMPVVPGYHPQQQMPPNWYHDPSSFGHGGEEETRDSGYGGYQGRHG